VIASATGLAGDSVDIRLIPNEPPSAPTNLLCNSQSAPAGLADYTPDFSWTSNDPDPGDYQTKMRLLVADTTGEYKHNTGKNIWDTGETVSSLSTLTYTADNAAEQDILLEKSGHGQVQRGRSIFSGGSFHHNKHASGAQ